MVVSNIKMAKQDFTNSKSESGLPCDKMFERLFSLFLCMRCAVIRASILYSDARLFNRMSEGYTVFIHA